MILWRRNKKKVNDETSQSNSLNMNTKELESLIGTIIDRKFKESKITIEPKGNEDSNITWPPTIRESIGVIFNGDAHVTLWSLDHYDEYDHVGFYQLRCNYRLACSLPTEYLDARIIKILSISNNIDKSDTINLAIKLPTCDSKLEDKSKC